MSKKHETFPHSLTLSLSHQVNIYGLKPPDLSVDNHSYALLKPLNFIYGALITNYELRITNYTHSLTQFSTPSSPSPPSTNAPGQMIEIPTNGEL